MSRTMKSDRRSFIGGTLLESATVAGVSNAAALPPTDHPLTIPCEVDAVMQSASLSLAPGDRSRLSQVRSRPAPVAITIRMDNQTSAIQRRPTKAKEAAKGAAYKIASTFNLRSAV